jgi:hypothetical protein
MLVLAMQFSRGGYPDRSPGVDVAGIDPWVGGERSRRRH